MDSYNITVRERLSAAECEKERDYWRGKFQEFSGKSFFVYDDNWSSDSPYKTASSSFNLPEALSARLLDVCGGSETKLQILLFSIAVILLHRYTGKSDITFGTTIDRQEPNGEYINTILPIRVQWSHCSFRELLPLVRETVHLGINHQNYPMKVLAYEDLELPVEQGFPLFDAGVLLENIQDNHYLHDTYTNIRFLFRLSETSIECRVEYNAALYMESSIQRIMGHFVQLGEAALADADQDISSLELVSPAEKELILNCFNQPDIQLSFETTFLNVFRNTAKRNPGRIALEYRGCQLSYGELDRQSDHVGRRFQQYGVSGHAVCLLLQRTPLLATCILAAWKAGGFYVPLDVQDPLDRTIGIAGDLGSGVLVVEAGWLPKNELEALPMSTIELRAETPGMNISEPFFESYSVQGDDIAYVIYTSGSTGKPKGAVIQHSGMLNHLNVKIEDLGISETSIIAQTASHTFDISVWQLVAPLGCGGKTIVYPNDDILDTEWFVTQLAKHNVTILEVVPSYLSTLLDAMEEAGETCRDIQYLLATGETLQKPLVKRWLALTGGIPLVNAYGPTEASDDITHHFIQKAPDHSRVPIGKPLENLNIFIVDPQMNLCPKGVVGEICVSGAGVGLGYLNDPEKTCASFPANHFGEDRGGILYKTGDLGRWLEDGSIEFFGRKDYQVKIRGYRIELGEIESAIVSCPSVKEAVVMDRQDSSGNKFLCAYIEPVDTIDFSLLKETLSDRLPLYMVPSVFCPVETFPLTRNGKIDRNALPEPGNEPAEIPFIATEQLARLNSVQSAERESESIGNSTDFIDDLLRQTKIENHLIEDYRFANDIELFPLSQAQKMMYFTEKKYPGTSCLNNVYTIRYRRQVSPRLLEQAINHTIRKYEGLRTRIVEFESPDGMLAAQYFEDYVFYQLDEFDFSGSDQGIDLQTWVHGQTSKPFDLLNSRLFYFAYIKFNERESGYYMKIHHIVSDAWTFNLLLHSIDGTLESLETDTDIEPCDAIPYSRYIQQELEYFKSPRALDDRAFWLEQAIPFPQKLPLGSKDDNRSKITGDVCKLTFPEELGAHIDEFCRCQNTTPYKLILSALAIYWARTMRLDEVMIGTVTHGRAGKQDRTIPGVYIRFIPIRVTLESELTFADLAASRCSRMLFKTLRHVRYPFHLLAAEIKEETGHDINYFLDINLIDHPDFGKENFSRELHYQGADPTPLTIKVNPSNKEAYGTLELEWNYQVERFSREDIQRYHQSLSFVLGEAMRNPGIGVLDIDIEPEARRKEMVGVLNQDDMELIQGVWVDLIGLEAFVMDMAKVESVAAIVTTDRYGIRRLVLFVEANSRLEREPLIDGLSSRFPWSASIGLELLQLQAMPLTGDGTIDRELLENVDPTSFKLNSYLAPRDEKEKKLVDTWKELLKRDHVGIDDDFFMIGGDSIKAIQLISRMKREGYQLEMKNVFEYPTVAQLAGQLKSEERTIDQSPVTGIIPLTPVQQLFFDFHRTAPHHYNQALILDFPPSDDSEALRNILGRIQQQHDALRLTFKQGDAGVIQENMDCDLPQFFEIHDFRDLPGAEAMMVERANIILSNVNLECGPLMKTALFRLKGCDRLLISIHYLVVDGLSWRVVLEDIDTLWKQARKGEKLELPQKTISFKRWSQWLSEYSVSGDYLEAESYWRELAIDGAAVVPVDYQHESNLVGESQMLSSKLGPEDTLLLLTEVNKAFNTEIMDILLTAFAMGIEHAFNSQTVEVLLEGHGRDPQSNTLNVSRTVGRFNSIYPVVLHSALGLDLARRLKETKEMLRRVPNKGIDYLIYRWLKRNDSGALDSIGPFPQIAFIYLGQIDAGLDGLSFDVLQDVGMESKSPAETRECEIDVVAAIENDDLTISANYNKNRFKKSTIEVLLSSFKKALHQLISFCSSLDSSEITPSDLTYNNISLDQLSALEDSLNE